MGAALSGSDLIGGRLGLGLNVKYLDLPTATLTAQRQCQVLCDGWVYRSLVFYRYPESRTCDI